VFGGYDQAVWFENTDGAGDFSSAKDIHVLNPEEQSISYQGQDACVAAVDLDNDGDLDLVASSLGGEEISWFENMDGEGTFSAANLVGLVDKGTVKVGRVSRSPNRRAALVRPFIPFSMPRYIRPVLEQHQEAGRFGVVVIDAVFCFQHGDTQKHEDREKRPKKNVPRRNEVQNGSSLRNWHLRNLCSQTNILHM